MKKEITLNRLYAYGKTVKYYELNEIDQLFKDFDSFDRYEPTNYKAIGVEYDVNNSYPGSCDVLCDTGNEIKISNDFKSFGLEGNTEFHEILEKIKKRFKL